MNREQCCVKFCCYVPSKTEDCITGEKREREK